VDRRELTVRRVTAADVLPLRHAILRPGRPLESAVFAGDDHPLTVHLAAYRGEQLVGVASLYAEPRAGGPPPIRGWRLRGMATEPSARGTGVGRLLLDACVSHVAGTGGGELWCNARTPAAGFYARAGFETVSDEFEIEGIGPHRVMRRLVETSPLV
jgi:GNAT superfamily N-acetyltransferase